MDLHAVEGAIPDELLEQIVGRIRRNPSHPGRHIFAACENKSLDIAQAAAFNVKRKTRGGRAARLGRRADEWKQVPQDRF